MLAQLKAGNHGHAREVVPLLAAAEELPLPAASLDLVTAFYCVTSTSWSWPMASRRNQGEPDGLARRARQGDQGSGHPDQRHPPTRLPAGLLTAAQITPVWTPPTSRNSTLAAAPNGGCARA